MNGKPLDLARAKQLIQRLIAAGKISFSGHALEKMTERNLTTVDCTNALAGGVVESAEWEQGSWRYRVRTARIYVVVAFHSEELVRVVTAWRLQG